MIFIVNRQKNKDAQPNRKLHNYSPFIAANKKKTHVKPLKKAVYSKHPQNLCLMDFGGKSHRNTSMKTNNDQLKLE